MRVSLDEMSLRGSPGRGRVVLAEVQSLCQHLKRAPPSSLEDPGSESESESESQSLHARFKRLSREPEQLGSLGNDATGAIECLSDQVQLDLLKVYAVFR